jgi:LysM repeat protein
MKKIVSMVALLLSAGMALAQANDPVIMTVNGKPVQTARPSATPHWVYYKVKSGDTLGKIARKYHTSVRQLKSWNNLKSDRIAIGQRLKVGKR